jgi:predicted lipoprotein with Yx(FWY)xxD motif
MKRMLMVIVLSLAASVFAGCGGDDNSDSGGPVDRTTAAKDAEQNAKTDGSSARKGPTLRLAESEFGQILLDSKGQAIYIFERDTEDESNCYGECAEAWPPVFAEDEPQASGGVKASLLGTTKRRDGKLQITYAGKPLYYYAHEGPGEVKCHNVNLNGGFWWVVGADGKRRP